MTDPYSILGVSKTATQGEIKKAYRKLAKALHPDLNPGNKEAEKKFKEASHAFDMIGTEEARAKFDRGETQEQQHEAYEQYQKKRGSAYTDSQRSGGGRYGYSFTDSFDDEDLFQNIFGRSRRPGRDQFNYPGEDELYQLSIDFKDSVFGAEKTITLPSGKKLQVKIPAGIEEGKKLRFKGLGGAGIGTGAPGDVYVEIHVHPSETFRRQGRDLEMDLPLTVFEAVTGGDILVKTLDGQVTVSVPAGVSTGTKLRIKGKGIGSDRERGNLIVVIKILGPKHPSPELVQELKALQAKFNYEVRP